MSNQIEYIKPDIEIFETVVEKGFASSHNGGHGGHGGHGGGHGGDHGVTTVVEMVVGVMMIGNKITKYKLI